MDPLQTPDDHALLSRRTLEIVMALLVLAFGALIVRGALEHNSGWSDRGPEPGYFPFWIGIIVLIGGAGVLVQSLLKPRTGEVFLTQGQASRLAAFTLPMIAFVGLSVVVGFYVATIAYLLFVMTVQGGYRLISALAVGVGTAAALFLMFEIWLKVPLLKGPLEARFGFY